MRALKLAWIGLAAGVLAIGAYFQMHWHSEIANARNHYLVENHNRTVNRADQVNEVLSNTYENLRTLASLPSVRNIDRHGENMSEEAHVTFQQIYNNLAESVAISEVYVLPIDFDPNSIDKVTGKPEAPIIAFDQLIVNAANGMTKIERQSHSNLTADPTYTGPAEIEDYEYRQLAEHAQWFKANYPTMDKINGLEVPYISGSEVITCDNTTFIKTGNDKDRSGIIFSVPFYDPAGRLKGMVSGIVLSNALRAQLPGQNLALVNPKNGYSVMGAEVAAMGAAANFVEDGQSDPSLGYSEALPLAVKDARSQWRLWAGMPMSDFFASRDVEAASQERNDALLFLSIFSAIAAFSLRLLQRNVKQADDLSKSLKAQAEISAQSARDAQDSAQKLQSLNDDVIKLNRELESRLTQLAEAQEEMIRRGKMAQLGNLVATVAHEIRNPLGGIRNTVFVLQRRFKAEGLDASAQFTRIETGIARCDKIISQLLDFSRSQKIECDVHDIVGWLTELLEDEAQTKDPQIEFKLVLPDTELNAGFDKERLRRAIVNIFGNACDAALARNAFDAKTPCVIVSLSQGARGVEISVKDNGLGISPDVLSKIGEPLFTTKSFGSGLGVAAARQVASLHGGGLDIHSEQGTGATFTLWLPMQSVRVIAA